MRRILIISELHLIETFMIPTVSKLKQEADVEFDCLIVAKLMPGDIVELKTHFTNVYFNKYPTRLLSWLPKIRFFQYMWGLRKLAKELPCYDVVHITYHHYYYAFVTPIIRKKTNKLYVTFYGSDFNDVSWFRHFCNKKTIALTDHIFATNPSLLRKILKKYDLFNDKGKTDILMHLMETFSLFEDHLTKHTKQASKRDLNVNDKLLICGYNANVDIRHEEIIKVLLSIKQKLKDYCVIFPMTYGYNGDMIRLRVKSLMVDSGLNYQVLEDFLPMDSLLDLRLAADIFIHILRRDQMASSMLEHLAAGSVVITGKWLPYESLEEMGIYFIRINTVDDLKETLLEVIEHLDIHLELCKKNREIMLKLMSWETNKLSWHEAYNLEIK